MSVAWSVFGHRQVFTAMFPVSIFFFKIVLDSFVFVLSQNRKMFYNSYPLWHLKKLMQAFSIIIAVFYCFLKIFAANPKGRKLRVQ